MDIKKLNISILVDDKDSWIVPFAEKLKEEVLKKHNVNLFFNAKEVNNGDMLFMLGCNKIVGNDTLKRNKNNLVIHESDLPKGRGFSPLSWHILNGENKIPMVLFEAKDKVDSGPIYLKDYIEFKGSELLRELKDKQGEKTIDMVLEFLDLWPKVIPKEQVGEGTYFEKRTKKDDMIDINKSIKDNFNHLRIVDNDIYPAWFEYLGERYILKIYKG